MDRNEISEIPFPNFKVKGIFQEREFYNRKIPFKPSGYLPALGKETLSINYL